MLLGQKYHSFYQTNSLKQVTFHFTFFTFHSIRFIQLNFQFTPLFCCFFANASLYNI